MTKFFVSLLALVLVAVAGSPANARTAVFIGVYDTRDPRIGDGAVAARAKLDGLFEDTQERLRQQGWTIAEYEFYDERFNIADLRPVVNSLTTLGPDDALIFYYVGHGQDDPADELPMLRIRDRVNGTQLYPGARLLANLSVNAGFILIVLDACNTDSLQRATNYPPPVTMGSTFNSNFATLIGNFRGQIVVASASEREVSWMVPQGSLFLLENFIPFTYGEAGTLRTYSPGELAIRSTTNPFLTQMDRPVRINITGTPQGGGEERTTTLAQDPFFSLFR